jgi:hypothetical protein
MVSKGKNAAEPLRALLFELKLKLGKKSLAARPCQTGEINLL